MSSRIGSVISLVGIRESTAVNVAFTLIEASGLVAMIVVASHARGILPPPLPVTNWPGVLEAAGFVFFANLGFEDIANVAEETIPPERLIPKAIIVAVAVTTFLYVGVALAAPELASPETLVSSSAPLADAVAAVLGEPSRLALSAVALFATANTVLLLLTAGSRMLFGMARAGVLPAVLAKVNPKTHTPANAILIQGLAAAALLPVGGIGVLGSLASWAALTAFIAVNAALLWLRRTQPDLPRPFRVPLSLGWVSLPALLGLLAALLASLRLAPDVIVIGIGVTVAGLPIYQLSQRQRSNRGTR